MWFAFACTVYAVGMAGALFASFRALVRTAGVDVDLEARDNLLFEYLMIFVGGVFVYGIVLTLLDWALPGSPLGLQSFLGVAPDCGDADCGVDR